VKGRVADGIDHRQISTHSGAEANIAGGLALLADPTVSGGKSQSASSGSVVDMMKSA
jgi:hypothetical protein